MLVYEVFGAKDRNITRSLREIHTASRVKNSVYRLLRFKGTFLPSYILFKLNCFQGTAITLTIGWEE